MKTTRLGHVRLRFGCGEPLHSRISDTRDAGRAKRGAPSGLPDARRKGRPRSR